MHHLRMLPGAVAGQMPSSESTQAAAMERRAKWVSYCHASVPTSVPSTTSAPSAPSMM